MWTVRIKVLAQGATLVHVGQVYQRPSSPTHTRLAWPDTLMDTTVSLFCAAERKVPLLPYYHSPNLPSYSDENGSAEGEALFGAPTNDENRQDYGSNGRIFEENGPRCGRGTVVSERAEGDRSRDRETLPRLPPRRSRIAPIAWCSFVEKKMKGRGGESACALRWL
ncbi:hypothetical protein KM043_007342 [Ampulex compressa]|nr:hypothetical protein KM043_007342 [Ampulex compressa]